MKPLLSIDGGGILGVIPAITLARIEHKTGKAIADLFSQVAGTSTGGIIACAAGKGIPMDQIASMYMNQGRLIFHCDVPSELRRFHNLLDTPYTQGPLRKLLTDLFGDTTIEQSKVPILVQSRRIDQGKDVVFKTKNYPAVTLIDAAMASSAAPTFFPPFTATVNGEQQTFVDGGVWGNNPAMCAISEAVNNGTPLEDIRVLSLGTGHRPASNIENLRWGQLQWLPFLASMFMESGADAIDFESRAFIGERYYRVEPATITPWAMDAVEHIKEMIIVGSTMADANESEIVDFLAA